MGIFDSLKSVFGGDSSEKWHAAVILEGKALWERADKLVPENLLQPTRRACLAAVLGTKSLRDNLEELRAQLPKGLLEQASAESLFSMMLAPFALLLGTALSEADGDEFFRGVAATSPRPMVTRGAIGEVASKMSRMDLGDLAAATLTAVSSAYGSKVNLGESGMLVLNASTAWGAILLGASQAVEQPGRAPLQFADAFQTTVLSASQAMMMAGGGGS